VLLVAGAWLMTALALLGQLWTTDLGLGDALVGGRRVVTEVDPDGAAARAGVRVGDEVIAAPGLDNRARIWTERESYAAAWRLGRAIERGRVPLRLRRGEATREVVVVPPPRPYPRAALRQLRRIGPSLPTTVAFLAIATLLARAVSRSPRDDRARRLVAAGCALLGPPFTIEHHAAAWPAWLYPLSSLFDVWCAPAGVLLLLEFVWSYPTRARVSGSAWVRATLIAVMAALGAVSSLNSLHVIDVPSTLRGNVLSIAATSLLAIAVLAGLLWQRAKARDVVARRQASWLLAFTGAGVLIPTAVMTVPERVFGGNSVALHALGYPASALIAIGLAVVVSRYRLFAFDGVASHVATYLVALACSLGVCAAATLALEDVWASALDHRSAQWIGFALALALVDPLRRAVQLGVDRVFARDRDAFLRRCAAYAARVAGAVDAGEIESEAHRTLDATGARLLRLREVMADDAAAESAAQLAHRETLRVVELRDPEAVERLLALGVELLVHVPAEGEALALGLTLPLPASSMRAPERAALALVGRIIGAALAQGTAQRALAAEKARALEERRFLAMELHDGLGATLTAARLMARRLREPSQPGEGETLDALDAALAQGLGDLRASVWSLAPTEVTWESLLARLRRQLGDACDAAGVTFEVQERGTPPVPVSARGRLGILRVVQEAVTNALKHGEATGIVVRIEVSPRGIEVTVEDDGVGLGPRLAGGHGLGNMALRVQRLGGSLRVDPCPTRGTRVSVSISLEQLTEPPSEGSAVA
jgi:signal transduction histidine kinase